MHWLSFKPCDLPDALHITGAAESTEKDVFLAQSEKDWESILLHRSKELVKGGSFVLALFCVNDEGYFLGSTGRGRDMHSTFLKIWSEMMRGGKISEAEWTATTFPMHYRTVKEIEAPFHNADSSVVQAGLRLKEVSTKVVPCIYAEEFRSHNDKEKFAAGLVGTMRTWSEHVFLSALDDSRSPAEKWAIVEEFYSTLKEEVGNDPQHFAMDYVHAYAWITKE
mmetsp:Transcript_24037/g.60900  ORF Transcript_24037/g.60900 Transcript_24037/m.60900 type:complete len:223 (+) Transcript_24037:622-1290(+)